MYVEREKNVLILTEPESDRFGTHFVSSRLFAAEYLKWGLRPEFIDIKNRPELGRALELLKEGSVALAHCEQGCGLELSVRRDSGPRNLFEHFKVPAVAHIRDYPFCEWMRPRLLGAGSTAVVFHTDELAPELVPKLGILKGQHLHAPHVYLDYRQPGPADIAAATRDINMLYVGSYREPEPFRDAFVGAHPDLRWAMDALIEAAVDDFCSPIHRILLDILAAHGGQDLDAKRLSDLLFRANQFIRFERRRRLFAALAPHPVEMIWAGPRPTVQGPVRASIRPAIRLSDTLELMSRARFMVMTLNNFSHSLSERMLSAMVRGCVPVVQANALIDREFVDGRELLLLRDDLGNLGDVIENCPAKDDFERISLAARQRVVHQFSPAARVREILMHPSVRRAVSAQQDGGGLPPAEPPGMQRA